jgi:hypothetical protein
MATAFPPPRDPSLIGASRLGVPGAPLPPSGMSQTGAVRITAPPVPGTSTPPPVSGVGPGLLRVVTPGDLAQHEHNQALAAAARPDEQTMDELAGHIRTRWEVMRNHRNSASGWNDRLLHAQRVFNGKYSPEQLAAIKQFGGSEVFARTIALKCRGASALLREVYLGTDRPWGLDPTPDPDLPDDIMGSVQALVNMEAQSAMSDGQQLDIAQLRDRTNQLIAAAKMATKKKAKEEAEKAEDALDDRLREGGFYAALTEFITDLPLFPFACIKGPVVRIVPSLKWVQGKAVSQDVPKMFWERKSAFDIYWTPGVTDIRDAEVIERQRLTRSHLNEVMDLPGYNKDNISKVLEDYGRGGLSDWHDSVDQERAEGESRESPLFNQSEMIDCLEYHGNVQGRMLRQYGFTPEEVPDELRDYFVQAWLIGRYIIKVQISPNPRKRHPYYITSFEKVPGTPLGNALPDILADIGDVCNATLRALVNNLSISSGPQVVVDEERLSPLENADEMYPWKRWRTRSDPLVPQTGSIKPVDFFAPPSHSQELLGVYGFFQNLADELSAIPRYITGSDKLGGAGRTASGLAMLMGNASKILQMVAQNVDHDVIQPLLQALYDMVMLTDQTGTFRGDEEIVVRGVEVSVQRETNRQRQIEALTATANPFDIGILGPEGRGKLLRSVLATVGIEDDIVPPDEELKAKFAGGMPGQPPMLPSPGTQPGAANTDLGIQDASAMRGMAGG